MKTQPLHRPALMFVALVASCAGTLMGQTYGVSAHTVTVSVQPIAVLQVTSGIVNLSIATANVIAGQDQMSVSDQSSSLIWGVNSGAQKITAVSTIGSPKYTLKLMVVGPTQGMAAPEATLTLAASDILMNIGRSSGSCALRYTGIALASQGPGSDAHTITFTIVAQ